MLEIACFNSSSAKAAAEAGADRIEFCAHYAAGGVTPQFSSLATIRDEVKIPINVMIRPRAGNFVYTAAEFEQMKTDIQKFKTLADGFVFGILDSDNRVDVTRNRELVDIAAPLPCTFHRAFDQVQDMSEAVEHIAQCGFKSILTSGGQPNAVLGASTIADLQKQFGQRISFIVGGGVRSSNAEALKFETKVQWLHSAAITGEGENVDADEVRQIQTELTPK